MSKKLNELVDVDVPEYGPITKEMVKTSQELSSKYGGNARVSMGRIWTTEEYEVRRKRILSTPLP